INRLTTLGRLCVEGMRYYHKYDARLPGILHPALLCTMDNFRCRTNRQSSSARLGGQKSAGLAEPASPLLWSFGSLGRPALLPAVRGQPAALHYLYCLTPHCLALCLLSESGFLLACWRALLRRVPLTGRRTPLGFVCDLTFIIVGLELCALSFTQPPDAFGWRVLARRQLCPPAVEAPTPAPASASCGQVLRVLPGS
uniref:G_PROTEIN_RECEP_F1_2 domain-containing protein n=1 Tax=Macrostomum lignano TaxID=282301 RepID=A0A1I8FHS0_9PLAT